MGLEVSMPKQGICTNTGCELAKTGYVQNRPDNLFNCLKCKRPLRPAVAEKKEPSKKKKIVAKIEKSPQEENLERIANEAKKRISEVYAAIFEKKLVIPIKNIANSWLTITDMDFLKNCIEALAVNMDKADIKLGSKTLKAVAETWSRPYGSFPGIIHEKAKGYTPISAIEMNPKYIQEAAYNEGDQYLIDTNFFKRTWTIIHELTHAILATNDYRVVKYNRLEPFFKRKYMRQSFALEKTKGITTTLEREYSKSRQNSAEDWAGFIMSVYHYSLDIQG